MKSSKDLNEFPSGMKVGTQYLVLKDPNFKKKRKQITSLESQAQSSVLTKLNPAEFSSTLSNTKEQVQIKKSQNKSKGKWKKLERLFVKRKVSHKKN